MATKKAVKKVEKNAAAANSSQQTPAGSIAASGHAGVQNFKPGDAVRKPDGRKAFVQEVGALINVQEEKLGETIPSPAQVEYYKPQELQHWI
jgi:hypothetical protein